VTVELVFCVNNMHWESSLLDFAAADFQERILFLSLGLQQDDLLLSCNGHDALQIDGVDMLRRRTSSRASGSRSLDVLVEFIGRNLGRHTAKILASIGLDLHKRPDIYVSR